MTSFCLAYDAFAPISLVCDLVYVRMICLATAFREYILDSTQRLAGYSGKVIKQFVHAPSIVIVEKVYK